MVKAEFNHQLGILDSKFEGTVTLQEIVDYIISTKENKTYPRVLKILTDATKANMNFSPDNLSMIVDENFKSIEKYEYIIDAIVLASPKETALSMLYQRLAKTNKYRFEIFSTREAAISWLAGNKPVSTANNA